MAEMERSIVVDVPVRAAYDQWTQFESFPQFMEGVREVRQIDDRTLEWRALVGGQEKSWLAVITDQEPDRRVAWRSVEGTANAGDVRFEAEGVGRTRVTLHLAYDPEGVLEAVGSAIGIPVSQIESDLDRFKAFIELHREPTGAWRGEIHPASEEGREPDADDSRGAADADENRRREHEKTDRMSEESFPASDPPSFMGGGSD